MSPCCSSTSAATRRTREQQAAGTVFSMINRYTEAVSAVIQRRGGTVVEFLGDGLMAVFGAPEPLPDHARVAVQAACEVVATVRDLALGASRWRRAHRGRRRDRERPGVRRQHSNQRPARLHRRRRRREPRLAHPGADPRAAGRGRHRRAHAPHGRRLGGALRAPRAGTDSRPRRAGRRLLAAPRRRLARSAHANDRWTTIALAGVANSDATVDSAQDWLGACDRRLRASPRRASQLPVGPVSPGGTTGRGRRMAQTQKRDHLRPLSTGRRRCAALEGGRTGRAPAASARGPVVSRRPTRGGGRPRRAHRHALGRHPRHQGRAQGGGAGDSRGAR